MVVLSHGINTGKTYLLGKRLGSLLMMDISKRCKEYHVKIDNFLKIIQEKAPLIGVTVFQKHIISHYKEFAHDLDKVLI